MNTILDPKQIILADNYDSCNRDDGYFDIDTIEEMMREYGRLIRDKTLEWAAENAKTRWDGNPYTGEGKDYVDEDSILNGKNSKDLEI